VAVAKSDPEHIRTFARERGWRKLRLLCGRHSSYSRDYHGEAPHGEQVPILNVFRRDGDAISFPVEGMDGGSISMLSVRLG